MRERYVKAGGALVFCRYRPAARGRPTFLFVHGLGDSGLSFEPAFARPELEGCGLIVPDLPGFGRSSAAADYGFAAQAGRLAEVVTRLGAARGLYVVAHSMGAIPAVTLCESEFAPHIQGLVLVEGSITQFGAFISAKAEAAYERGEFTRWFEADFLEHFIRETYVRRFPFCAGYYASLRFCRPPAFLASALEMRRLARSLPEPWSHETGARYASLALPRLYVYGRSSLAAETVRFLDEHGLAARALEADCHFVMLELPDAFYGLLAEVALRPG
jgi:pimeloyl-ACP methyl ester carboxylesterase